MSPRPKLVILGGSSPFTAGFVQAVVEAHASLAQYDVVLQGRSVSALTAMQHHFDARLGPLGWTVRSTQSREEALEGAAVILHQVRYGGLDGRAEGERLAGRFHIQSDETLGPAALQCAVRSAGPLHELGQELARLCPEAWILNLTNPLSLTTALLARYVPRCVGLCELPRVTAEMAAQRLGVEPSRLSWSYCGLNHRGFIHRLSMEGANLLPEVAQLEGELNGIDVKEIRELGVIPLKYFRLFSLPSPAGATKGRAEFLSTLRDKIQTELERAPAEAPPSLALRYMDWYPLSVVPFLTALAANHGKVEVVNVLQADGLVREVRARVFQDRLETLESSPPPEKISTWLTRFEQHERASLELLEQPTPERLENALSKDPLVPADVAGPAAQFMWKQLQEGAS